MEKDKRKNNSDFVNFKKLPVDKISFEKIAFTLIWVGLFIMIVSFLVYLFKEEGILPIKDESLNLLGQVGQYMEGVVGSLWALAGVILFYETLRFQRSELKLQREELEYQRNEIMEQTHQYIIQNQTLITRKLEGTFFQLISLHNEIVDTMNIDLENHKLKYDNNSHHEIKGRYCFGFFYKYFKYVLTENIDLTGIVASDTEDMKQIINESFNTFFLEFHEDISHYFRNLFNLALYIDKSHLKNKRFYYNIIRSLLSNYELILLFYYCLSGHGEKMKILAERYSLFIQLPVNEIIDKRHMDIFDPKAFVENDEIKVEEGNGI